MLHAGPTLETGEWYFASVRFDKDDELQVTVIPDSDPLGGTVVPANTGSQASALAGGVTYSASQQTLLGVEAVGGPAGNAFDGRMDDVAFYGSVLGDDQVKFVRRFGAQNSLPDEAWDGADPGASPAEVEEGIVLKVEEAVSGLDGIKNILAQSREGLGTVVVEVQTGTDVGAMLDRRGLSRRLL